MPNNEHVRGSLTTPRRPERDGDIAALTGGQDWRTIVVERKVVAKRTTDRGLGVNAFDAYVGEADQLNDGRATYIGRSKIDGASREPNLRLGNVCDDHHESCDGHQTDQTMARRMKNPIV